MAPNHWHLSLSTIPKYFSCCLKWSQNYFRMHGKKTESPHYTHTHCHNVKSEPTRKIVFAGLKKKWIWIKEIVFVVVCSNWRAAVLADLCATFAGPTVNTRSSSARQEYPTAFLHSRDFGNGAAAFGERPLWATLQLGGCPHHPPNYSCCGLTLCPPSFSPPPFFF